MKIYTTALDGEDRRQHDRLYHHAVVKLIRQAKESIIGHTLNLSDGGLLIKCTLDPLPAIGDVLEVQSMDFPEAPIKKVVVRRVAALDQMGVQFV